MFSRTAFTTSFLSPEAAMEERDERQQSHGEAAVSRVGLKDVCGKRTNMEATNSLTLWDFWDCKLEKLWCVASNGVAEGSLCAFTTLVMKGRSDLTFLANVRLPCRLRRKLCHESGPLFPAR